MNRESFLLVGTCMKLFKKAFTLIEMLIVIVIIGILASALIPRLVSTQDRARDTQRKVDLRNIGTALASYKQDVGDYPVASGLTTSDFDLNGSFPLVPKYLTSLPYDPTKASYLLGNYVFSGGNPFYFQSDNGAYGYMYKPGSFNPGGNVIMFSRTESTAGANWFGGATPRWMSYDTSNNNMFFAEGFRFNGTVNGIFYIQSVAALQSALCQKMVYDGTSPGSARAYGQGTTIYEFTPDPGNECHYVSNKAALLKYIYIF